jgi:hypothetical protein
LSAPTVQAESGSGAGAGESLSKPYGALKGYFHTPKRGEIWGAFCLLFNGAKGETMENLFWATRSLTGPAIDVSVGWREMARSVSSMGVYEKSLSEKLGNSLLELFPASVRIEMLKAPDIADRVGELAEQIRNHFERVTHCFLEFQLQLELLSRQDLIDAGVLQGELTNESNEALQQAGEEEKSYAGTLVTCVPVIDPVRGKPVSEIVPGDKVHVKVQGRIGDMVQKFLNSANQDSLFEVDAVEKRDDEKTCIFLKISDEIKGLITVTKDIRLSVAGTSVKKRVITLNLDNLIFFGIFGVSILVILLVIRFLFF